MGLRQVPLFLVILTALSLSLGCGIIPGFGGDDEDADLGMIEFADDGEIVLEPEEIIAGALSSIDPEVLIEIRFLYYFQVRLERLRQLIRDLNFAVEYSGPADVNLDWVIEVHDVTRESDDFFRVLTSLDVPESQREQYQHLQIGMLETVQVAAYGADRILAASVVVPVRVINLGLRSFAVELEAAGVEVLHVDWRPPSGGDARLLALLAVLQDEA